MQPCTAIALSGGIDSLVAAALLKEQGRPLIGMHFINGFEDGAAPGHAPSSRTSFSALQEHAQRMLHPLADQLDIPIYIIDLRAEFKSRVVDYFIDTYRQGKTPNPCIVCNPLIKFNILFEKARAWGATQMASGHYARIETAPSGLKRLFSGKDKRKDQSYFLARLSQQQLGAVLFPLGELTKDQTRRIAREKGLIPVTAQESQDVCFIKDGSYGDFLAQQPGFTSQAGPIEDVNGRGLGRHKGLHRFTIGQRRGINCPSAEPYYVVRLEQARNCLVVGGKEDLFSAACRVHHINWIATPPDGPLRVMTRVRYRHKAVPSTLTLIDAATAHITFDSPESAVTPGQGAVFYQDDEVLGGGWIE